jgi:hypothetical protein
MERGCEDGGDFFGVETGYKFLFNGEIVRFG